MKFVSLIVATTLIAAVSVQAQQTTQVPMSPAQQYAFDRQLTQLILEVLKATEALKPGMTRADVLREFVREGGVFTRTQRTYVYRDCSYMKITVKFSSVPGTENDAVEELPGDKIVEVSQPFLAGGVYD